MHSQQNAIGGRRKKNTADNRCKHELDGYRVFIFIIGSMGLKHNFDEQDEGNASLLIECQMEEGNKKKLR